MNSHGSKGDESRATGRTRTPKRSRTGCPECRKRRVKCDEAHPSCGQCRRSGRECHITDTVFRPHVLSFQEPGAGSAQPPPNSSDSPSESRDDHDHYDEAMSTSIDQEVQDARQQTANTVQQSQPLQPHTGSAVLSLTEDRLRLVAQDTQLDDASINDVTARNLDKLEESFFLRYFSESIAPWFDVVNFQRYFGHECIVLTREHSLLRFAACALAAKQLGQASMSTADSFRNRTQRSIAQRLLRGELDFIWYGAKYYDKAIKTLARQITPREPLAQPSPSVTSSIGSMSQSDIMTRAEGEDPIVRLLSTCILIQYESLSGNAKGWSGHLNGFDKLLALLDDGSLFYTNPLSREVFDAKSQRALRAAFWWFAINDLEESFIARRVMRIDVDNLSLWRHMGLHMYENGEPVNLETCETPGAPPHLQGDLLSFSVIRTICKLVNFVALSPKGSTGYSAQGASQLNDQTQRVAQYRAIHQALDAWYATATAAFHADFQCSHSFSDDLPYSPVFASETWYSHSFRAVTMMYYHMSRMLLIIHRPSSLFDEQFFNHRGPLDMLRALKEIEQWLRGHATEIISIVNGMLDDGSVRVRALQPLYVAGRSLSEAQDRCRLIRLIRAIQDDVGLACEYRIHDLLHEWDVSLESLGLENIRGGRNPADLF